MLTLVLSFSLVFFFNFDIRFNEIGIRFHFKFKERARLRSIEAGTERKSWAPSFPRQQIGGEDIEMANVVNTALLQEVVTELNSSASNSEGIAPRHAGTGSDSIHNEHLHLLGFQYRGRYIPFGRGGPRPLKAPKPNRQPT